MGQRDFRISEIERLEKVNLELIKDLEFRRELYKVLQTRSDGIEQERDEARAAIHPPCPQCGGSGKYAIETQSAAIIVKLREYNLWRRGSDQLAQPNPTDIGLYIDIICDIVERLERARDELRADQSNQEDMLLRYMDEVDEARDLCAALQLKCDTMQHALDDWENAAKHVELEHKDEVHCGCVCVLRKLLSDARRERDEAREAFAVATSQLVQAQEAKRVLEGEK